MDDEKLIALNRFMYEHEEKKDKMNNWDGTRKVVPGTALSVPQGVNVLGANSRAGYADRDQATKHVMQMVGMGYITVEEAEKRVKVIEAADNKAMVQAMTADLPAPVDDRQWYQKYDWNKTSHWVPTLIGAMMGSAILAVVPVSLLSTEHLFPNNPLGLVAGVLCLILGVLGFFGSLTGIIVKGTE